MNNYMNKSYDVHVDRTSAALLVHLLLQSHDKTLYSISHNQTDNFSQSKFSTKKNKFGTCSVENTDYETSLSIISQQNNGFSDSHITISDIFRIFSEMWFPKFHTL